MASFTEIVMSPVRLFKPSEHPARSNTDSPPLNHKNKKVGGIDGKDDALPKKKTSKLPFVQRLNFDTESSNVSNSEQDKVRSLQNGTEHRSDSIPGDDRSFGLINSVCTRSTYQITEAVRASKVQQCSREEKHSCKSTDLHPLTCTGTAPADDTDSTRTSLKKGSGVAVWEWKGLCEQKVSKHTEPTEKRKYQDQALPKKLGLTTPAVGKRKKGSRPERRKREEMMKRAETEDAARTLDQEKEFSAVTQTKTPGNPTLVQTLKRRKVYISDECLSTSSSLEREEVSQTEESRKIQKKKEGNTRVVTLDITSDSTKSTSPDLPGSTPAGGPPSSGSMTWASSRTTRQLLENSYSDPTESLGSNNRTSESKPAQRNRTCQSKHNPKASTSPATQKKQPSKKRQNVRRVRRAVDEFDQGMSMSLTLKLGSGLDKKKDVNSIMTCGITTGKGGIMGEVLDPDKKDAEHQRRWCVSLEKRGTQEEGGKEEGPTSSGLNRLKRSLSCPDITALQHSSDAPAAPINGKAPSYASPLKKVSHLNVNALSPFKRTRRHTVCSLEIEREIAPLCLRKEVYPLWAGTSSFYPHSPFKSPASFVSCFLSSPLAFLSKKSVCRHTDDSGYGASSSDLTATSSSSPLPPSENFSSASGSVFFDDVPRTPERPSLSSHCR